MKTRLEKLKELPISLRLIHEIHKCLLSGVRGQEKTPGEYKRYQNWIGPAGCNLNEAIFVPPPPNMMIELMGDWEKCYYEESGYTDLVNACSMAASTKCV